MTDMMESEVDIAADCPDTESTRVCTDQICLECGGNAVLKKKKHISLTFHHIRHFTTAPPQTT